MPVAFLFDLDGVIVDTAYYHYLAWQRLADELGFSFTEKDNEGLKGVSRMQALDILLELGGLNFSEREKLDLAARKNRWYVAYLETLDESHILPGAAAFIADARKMGIKIALGSASKNARTILEKLQLQSSFDAIVDGTMTTRAKPDPEVFQLGASMLEVSPKQCVVFEDAQAGIEAALSAGMIPVGIGRAENLKGAALVTPNLEPYTAESLLKKLKLI